MTTLIIASPLQVGPWDDRAFVGRHLLADGPFRGAVVRGVDGSRIPVWKAVRLVDVRPVRLPGRPMPHRVHCFPSGPLRVVDDLILCLGAWALGLEIAIDSYEVEPSWPDIPRAPHDQRGTRIEPFVDLKAWPLDYGQNVIEECAQQLRQVMRLGVVLLGPSRFQEQDGYSRLVEYGFDVEEFTATRSTESYEGSGGGI